MRRRPSGGREEGSHRNPTAGALVPESPSVELPENKLLLFETPSLWDSGMEARAERELPFHGDQVSIWDNERAPEMDGGDGRTTVQIYLTSELYTHNG